MYLSHNFFATEPKKNINDARESPALYIIESLQNLGANVRVYDPYVSVFNTQFGTLYSQSSIEEALKDVDCAIFLVDHDEYRDIDQQAMIALMKHPINIDCKNISEIASNASEKDCYDYTVKIT